MENNHPPFRIGQKVVCIKSGENGFGIRVEKGEIHTITDLLKCHCGLRYVDIGLRTPRADKGYCQSWHIISENDVVWVYEDFFAPIKEQYADCTSEIAQSLSITPEVPDTKVKEIVQ